MIRVLRSSRNEIVVLSRGFVCYENIYRKGCAIMLLPTRNLYRFLLVEFLVLLSLYCVLHAKIDEIDFDDRSE